MNNIDILEELKKNLDEIIKEPLGKDEMSNGNLYEYERGYELDLQEIQAVLNLMSENKEKEEALEEWINGERHCVNCVPKSKIEEKIGKLKTDLTINNYGERTRACIIFAIKNLQELL